MNTKNLNLSGTSTISLTYKLNRIGPKAEPCGTPQTIFVIPCCAVEQTATCFKNKILEHDTPRIRKIPVKNKNSETNTSELAENLEEIFPLYYMHNNVFGMFKSSTNHILMCLLSTAK